MGQLIKRHINATIDSLNENERNESLKNFNMFFNDFHLAKLKSCVNELTISSDVSVNFSRYISVGEYLKRDKTEIFQFLFYAHQFALASSKLKYSEKAVFTIGKKVLEFEGRNKSLTEERNAEELQRYLQTFIPLAFIMRDEQAKAYYSELELFYTKRPYYTISTDFLFAKLFSLMCSGDIVALKEHLSFLVAFEENEYIKRKTADTNSYYGFEVDNFSIYSSAHVAQLYESEQIEYLKLPFLEVLKSIFEEDEVNFNKNLLIALEKHKEYYGTYQIEREEINDRPEGWVSLWLTCACVIAHDKGMKREVASDYIPEWIVKGEFEGLELVVE